MSRNYILLEIYDHRTINVSIRPISQFIMLLITKLDTLFPNVDHLKLVLNRIWKITGEII